MTLQQLNKCLQKFYLSARRHYKHQWLSCTQSSRAQNLEKAKFSREMCLCDIKADVKIILGKQRIHRNSLRVEQRTNKCAHMLCQGSSGQAPFGGKHNTTQLSTLHQSMLSSLI
ncbi:uncharacterized protein LOC141876263 [Acropora palmata]|uniref:uncharacterized protein LOC141876263 n=1 Tax=Acropora palmata TaxID=6131 RepID=UPI003DA1776F